MENNFHFPKKVLDDVSGSKLNLIPRKGGKKGTFGSRYKNLQKSGTQITSTSSLINLKSKKDKEKTSSSSENKSLLILEEIEEEKKRKSPKKKEENKEKRYIVDNMEDILPKLSSEKIKLIIQETLLYIIVFMVCVYHWIFLFISRDKLEQNFCYSNSQFDACSEDQICKDYSTKMNIILFNNTLK